jgi:hypothetical protein
MLNHTEDSLWKIFSKFIRARDANWQGYCKCISCSAVKKWKEMDAGHFINQGSDYGLKYNENNVNAQCSSCNLYKSGNLFEYRFGLVSKIGEDKVKQLEQSHYFKSQKLNKKLNQLQINIGFDFYNKKFKELSKEKCL